MIRKVLIANRGEIARRVMRAARSLGISTVAVYSDADAAAVYVREADEAVRLPGTAASETYLVAARIIEAARLTGADAIHPGYGFLSENASFAAACEAAGIVFVGPAAEAIRQMGDKLEAKAIMAANGVPTLPSVTVVGSADGPAEVDVAQVIAEVGLPAIIKASAGGGGRGMRIVADSADFAASLESARREAQSAFGDPTVFVERYISPARHIEVQVVADSHGACAALFERECSIQRRHQKVVEEAPSTYVDDEMRAKLLDAATKAVEAVDYRGVGTVEFVAGDGLFAFLEMNTRLQVEHPVTELVTGVDLVRLQFEIAAGGHLPPEVLEARISGHAIEVRLCAEDPAAGYLPASGRFALFEFSEPGLRLDSGVESGSEVPPYYDSMVAKVIAHGTTRAEAAAKLARGLERARLHGVVTNRDLLVNVLRSRQFLAGDTTTDFLERVPGLTGAPGGEDTGDENLGGVVGDPHAVNAVAAAVAADQWARRARPVQPGVPSGWRNNRTSLEPLDLSVGDRVIRVGYDLSRAAVRVAVDGEPLEVSLHGVTPAAPVPPAAGALLDLVVDLTVAGVRRRYRVAVDATQVLVDGPLGSSSFERVGRFTDPEDVAPAGGLTAPMPGKVVRTLAQAGEAVSAGDPLVVLEAMKMEHTIASPVEGQVVELFVKEGDQVERGAVLAAVEER